MKKLNMDKLKSFFTKKRIIILVSIIVVIALLTTIIAVAVKSKGNEEEENSNYIETTAQIGSITKTIEASGVIEPNDRYEITALVKGEILEAPFEEGDFVNEDDVLYRIDDEDAQITIEKTNNSIAKSQISHQNTLEDISKLNIYAPASGVLGSLKLKETAQSSTGEVATITNTDELVVKVPFLASDFDGISLGDSVTLTSAMYMTSLEGTVTYKFSANESTALDGSSIRNVEITVPNPGALGVGTTVSATVHTRMGDVQSAASGTVENGTVTSVIADVSGTVKTLYVKEGDYVEKGQLIAVLENESLMDEVRSNEISMADNELSLRSSIKNLENYTITSPISGTVITKNSKVGDKIDNSNSQTVMMVVADMSKVKFLISVDELDISSVQLGQTAIVDADAITDKTFNGTVTNIAAEGVSTGDGVTTYDVEITIDEPGELKSGMNVNANIVVAEATNVVTIPEEALSGSNGSTAMVLVKSTDENGAAVQIPERGNRGEMPNGMPNADMPRGERPEGGMPSGEMPNGEMPQGVEVEGERPQGGMPGDMPNAEAPSGEGEAPSVDMPNADMPQGGRQSNIPEGFVMRRVELGISDGTNIEIKSGLSEGDVITYVPTTASSDGMFPMMMGGGMGGPQGRMPAGGPQSGGQQRTGGQQRAGGAMGGR